MGLGLAQTGAAPPGRAAWSVFPRPSVLPATPARVCQVLRAALRGLSGGCAARTLRAPPRAPTPQWVCRRVRDRTAVLGVRAARLLGAAPGLGQLDEDSPLSLRKQLGSPAEAGGGASRLPADVRGHGSARFWAFPAACERAPRRADLHRLRRASPGGGPALRPWAPCPPPAGCSAGCGVCCAAAERAVTPCGLCSPGGALPDPAALRLG